MCHAHVLLWMCFYDGRKQTQAVHQIWSRYIALAVGEIIKENHKISESSLNPGRRKDNMYSLACKLNIDYALLVTSWRELKSIVWHCFKRSIDGYL